MVAAGYIDQATADQSAAVDIHGPTGGCLYEGKSGIIATAYFRCGYQRELSMNMV